MSKTPSSEPADAPTDGTGSTDRRTFMKTAAAGATAAGLGAGVTGTAAAAPVIPTPQLTVEGNVFQDPEGNDVTLRGVNIVDPRRANTLASVRGKNAEQMVDLVTNTDDDWHSQVIRIPCHPTDILGQETGYAGGPATPGDLTANHIDTYIEEHLEPVVDHCAQRGAYAILDYHRHWTNGSSEGSNPEFEGYWTDDPSPSPPGNIIEPLRDECEMFWDHVAGYFGDHDHCLFEVYNEPTEPGMWEDPFSTNWAAEPWPRFVDLLQPAVDMIDSHTSNPQLLGSPSWTQSPEGILLTSENYAGTNVDFQQFEEPENLAMTYHIYGGHFASQNEDWSGGGGDGPEMMNGDGTFGVFEDYPLVVTEFGYDADLSPPLDDENPLGADTPGFGDPFIDWMESGEREASVSWTAWCADIWWDPAMFDRAFEGTDTDISNPYEEDIPNDCPDLPCEWELKTGDDYMGDTVKQALIDVKDHNNPAGDVTPPEDPCEEVGADQGMEIEGEGWVCDVNGDGKFRDVNADGTVGQDDVVYFFERQHREVWKQGPFDFSGNGSVGHGDVVTLFEYVSV